MEAKQITCRDKALFHFLFENRIATLEQLREQFFREVSRQTTGRRLLLLARAGWIRRFGQDLGYKYKLAFELTPNGFGEYVKVSGVNDRWMKLSSDKVEHDITLVDLRKRLERRPRVKQVYPENVFQAHHELADSKEFRPSVALRSDAVIKLDAGPKQLFFIPVEYEATQKSRDRWERKMLDYYLKHPSGVVLWICKNHSIIEQMAEIDLKLKTEHEHKMYFACLADVQKATNELTFTNSKKDRVVTI